jgi:hypothetical protein
MRPRRLRQEIRQRQDGAPVRLSLLEQIGWKGLLTVVWQGTPPLLRPFAVPYGLVVYRRLLASSEDPEILYTCHTDKYRSSLLYKLLRPRYHVVSPLLTTLVDRRCSAVAAEGRA